MGMRRLCDCCSDLKADAVKTEYGETALHWAEGDRQIVLDRFSFTRFPSCSRVPQCGGVDTTP
jgi:hypothetical protein